MVTFKCLLESNGLGWIAINEFAMIRELPYCRGIENYRECKTFLRSYASGTFVFEVPGYFSKRFRRIWESIPLEGPLSAWNALPKRIPTEMESRLLDLMDDHECLRNMKLQYVKWEKFGIQNKPNESIWTEYGEFPYSFLDENVFSKIDWFERLLLKWEGNRVGRRGRN